jgi:hypothetical protein
MAPTRSKKRKSTESQSSVDVQSFPAPPAHTTTMKMRDPNSTPIGRSPIKKAPRGITVNQKQALIDNLQLESMYATRDVSVMSQADKHGHSYRTSSKTARPIYNASSGPTNTHRNSRQSDTNGITKGKYGRALYETQRGQQVRCTKQHICNSPKSGGITLQESDPRESRQRATQPKSHAPIKTTKVSKYALYSRI